MYQGSTLSLPTDFIHITSKLAVGQPVTAKEVERLLLAKTPGEIDHLFTFAREQRARCFGTQVFLYGFLYFSTYCRNSCTFCSYRKENGAMDRYRKTTVEIVEAAVAMAASGVHLIDLTMGEDPAFYAPRSEPFADLLKAITAIKDATGLPVMVSPGAVADQQLAGLAEAGADWYACYQETHNRDHYSRLRSGQDYDYRMERKQKALALGMQVEEGILIGAGEDVADIAASLLEMQQSGARQVRAMRFVPPKGYTGKLSSHHIQEETVIAVMRLLMPDRLIPASLDVDGLAGLEKRLDAGANVITSIIPAHCGLAGVANSSLDIEENRRSPDHVAPVVHAGGLEIATSEHYLQMLLQH